MKKDGDGNEYLEVTRAYPGYSKDDISVKTKVVNGENVVEIKNKSNEESDGFQFYVKAGFDVEKIKAVMKNGLLTVTIPVKDGEGDVNEVKIE